MSIFFACLFGCMFVFCFVYHLVTVYRIFKVQGRILRGRSLTDDPILNTTTIVDVYEDDTAMLKRKIQTLVAEKAAIQQDLSDVSIALHRAGDRIYDWQLWASQHPQMIDKPVADAMSPRPVCCGTSPDGEPV